jgi:acyl transferase domain-containing protein/acyl carrier protein
MQNNAEKYYAELMTKASKRIASLEAELAHTRSAATEPLAVIGIGCRFPGAENPAAFWQLLRNGVDMVREVPAERWDIDAYYDPDPDAPGKMVTRYGSFLEHVDTFDAHFFGVSPREAVTLDPQQRILLEVTWEALEDAALSPTALPRNSGVFIGISTNEYLQHLLKRGPEQIDAYLDTGNAFSTASGRLAYLLDLHGPCFAIETACSSSLVAVHQACQSLRRRECDAALAGGVGIVLSPDYTINFSKARMMAADGRCKTFDAAANGYVRGDGCGLIILKRLADAVANGDRVLAVIRGSAINQDGRTSALTVPNGPAQQAVIRQALNDGGLEATQVSYIEAHGTGTALGDPIEMGALGEVFGGRDEPLYVGSLKTNMGHLEAAAGIAGLIKTVLALQHGEIPPHLHFQHPSPRIDWEQLPVKIPTTLTAWTAATRIAGVSSFGFSGTNAHVVLEAWHTETAKQDNKEPNNQQANRSQLLTLSAKSTAALRVLAQRYVETVAEDTNVALADVAYTTHVGRAHFTHRLGVVVASHTELRQRLTDWLAGQAVSSIISGVANEVTPRIAFLFTGQGSQYIEMGRELYETQPIFRRTLDHCDAILRPMLGDSILTVLYPDEQIGIQQDPATGGDSQSKIQNLKSKIDDTAYAQPALFALEYALATLWKSWGIEPDFVVGHSVGEYVAACVAGVFTLEDGLKLIAARSRLMGALPTGGSMVAVAATAERVQSVIAAVAAQFVAAQPTAAQSIARQVVIAAYNAPESVVISGASAAIAPVVAALTHQGIECKALAVSHAFHSPLMEAMLVDFAAVAKTIPYARPQMPIITNLTGKLSHDPKTITKSSGHGVQTAEICSANYWVRHVRQPVRFAESIATLQQMGIDICLEVGPKPTLLGLVRQCLDTDQPITQQPLLLPSLRAGRADWETLLTSLGQLYVQGAAIDWAGVTQGELRQRISLPTYPFQRQRYWADLKPQDSARTSPLPMTTDIVHMMDQGHVQQMCEQLTRNAHLSVEESQFAAKLLKLLVAEHQAQRAQTNLADWLYTIRWTEIHSHLSIPLPVGGRWLIFADRQGIGEALAKRLRQTNQQVWLVWPHTEFKQEDTGTWSINATIPDDFVRLLHKIDPTQPLQGVIYLWGVDTPTMRQCTDATATEIMQQLESTCGSALYLVQSLLKTYSTPPALWLISQDAQVVTADDPMHGLAQSPLWGIGKTLGLEYPLLPLVCLDLDAHTGPAESSANVFTELQVAKPDPETQVAWRKGLRYGARLEAYTLKTNDSQLNHKRIRQDGAYLITGGLGGLGLRMAQWLVAQGAKYLVLVGRSHPKPEAETILAELRQQGVEVVVAQTDVADSEQMAAVLTMFSTQTKSWNGGCAVPLYGVIHTAGTTDDGSLLNQNWTRFEQVLSPKVQGVWNLHRLTQSHPLDFFVLFSSTAALYGSAGQANYTTANLFLDAIAHYRYQRGLPALSIAWGDWSEVGMSARMTAANRLRMQERGEGTLAPTQALLAFARLLGQPSAHIGVASIDWGKYVSKLVARAAFFTTVANRQGATNNPLPQAQPQINFVQQLHDLLPKQRYACLVTHLQEQVIAVMGMKEELDPRHGFTELGLDSLMAIELKKRLERSLEVTLPATLIYEYSTIDRLATHLLQDVLNLMPSGQDVMSRTYSPALMDEAPNFVQDEMHQPSLENDGDVGMEQDLLALESLLDDQNW